ncbi:MAG TPA: family 16 glycoside hydrolase, partial [Planctomycetota bacterium]|nr:family 16 glycoside hydrolase [Planctomycetota bacterium]
KFDIVPGNKENKSAKEGEWSAFEIVVTDQKIEHKIGGETVRTATLKADAPASPFRLRAEFGSLEVKNLRVKE